MPLMTLWFHLTSSKAARLMQEPSRVFIQASNFLRNSCLLFTPSYRPDVWNILWYRCVIHRFSPDGPKARSRFFKVDILFLVAFSPDCLVLMNTQSLADWALGYLQNLGNLFFFFFYFPSWCVSFHSFVAELFWEIFGGHAAVFVWIFTWWSVIRRTNTEAQNGILFKLPS